MLGISAKPRGTAALSRSPVVRLLFVVHMPHTSDERMVPLFLGPRDGFMLRFERGQHVVRMILDNIIVNVRSLLTPLRIGRAST